MAGKEAAVFQLYRRLRFRDSNARINLTASYLLKSHHIQDLQETMKHSVEAVQYNLINSKIKSLCTY